MLRKLSTTVLSCITLSLILTGCASNREGAVNMQAQREYDPLEPFNRCVYKFNYMVDGVLIKPLAIAYKTVTPEPVRDGVSRFFSNLTEPVSIANSVLQGNGEQAFAHFWRFVLNSTLGVGGVFDFAGEYGLYARNEDFGQTLGRYGVGSGPFLMLPILGPSSARDAVGIVADSITDPFHYYTNGYWTAGRAAGRAIDRRYLSLDFTEEVDKNSLDPYATYRSGYLQYRQNQVELRN